MALIKSCLASGGGNLLGAILTVTDAGWMAHGSIITADGNVETQTSAATFTLTNGDFTLTKVNNSSNNGTFTSTRNCKLIDSTGAVAYTVTANVPVSVEIAYGWAITT